MPREFETAVDANSDVTISSEKVAFASFGRVLGIQPPTTACVFDSASGGDAEVRIIPSRKQGASS